MVNGGETWIRALKGRDGKQEEEMKVCREMAGLSVKLKAQRPSLSGECSAAGPRSSTMTVITLFRLMTASRSWDETVLTGMGKWGPFTFSAARIRKKYDSVKLQPNTRNCKRTALQAHCEGNGRGFAH